MRLVLRNSTNKSIQLFIYWNKISGEKLLKKSKKSQTHIVVKTIYSPRRSESREKKQNQSKIMSYQIAKKKKHKTH